MKKNVIALAVAAAMAAPLAAQAEVTVSGVLQAELLQMSGDTTEGMFLGGGKRGKLEFKASEDLGDGMKAIAKYGMNADVDGKAISQRDAYVGLTGSFGTVLAGTMSNPYKSSTVSWDPFLETSAQARSGNGMSGLHNSYTSNAIAYANKFGMAKVVAAIVIDDATDDADPNATSGDHATSVSVNMPVGPVEVAIAYISTTDLGTNTTYNITGLGDIGIDADGGLITTNSTGSETGDNVATKVGVKYTAGAIGVAFQYETIDTGVTTDYMYLNGTYAAGANTFAAAYGQKDNDGNSTDTYMSAGMIHSFSKNTKAYVAYVANANDAANTDTTAIAAGLRVGF